MEDKIQTYTLNELLANGHGYAILKKAYLH